MKLLTSERDFRRWFFGSPQEADRRRPQFGPTTYPCYVAWEASEEGDEPELLILYLADVQMMLSDLLKHTPAAETV